MDPAIIVLIVASIVLPILINGARFIRWLFQLEPDQVRGFVVKNWRPVLRRAYTGFAFLISAFLVWVMIQIVTLVEGSLGISLMLVIMLWSIIGIWSPFVNRPENPALARVFNVAALGLGAVLLVGFWFFKWPDWQLPLTLTLIVIALAILAFVKWLRTTLCDNRQ